MVKIGATAGKQSADDLDGPGGIVKTRFVAAGMIDDALPDPDVGEQFAAGSQGVDQQHGTQQCRGEQPGEDDIRAETERLLRDIGRRYPACGAKNRLP
jgi:hypothetical protein